MQKTAPLLFSLFLIAADQISKWWVTEWILRENPPGTQPGFIEWYMTTPDPVPFTSIMINSFFNLVMVWNKGISFGLFNRDTDYGSVILVALSLAITALFLVFLFRKKYSFPPIGLALVIGGALGNVIDRFRFGAVIDFLDFHVAGYHWPAFNVADSCICIGVAVLIIHSLFFEEQLHPDSGTTTTSQQ